ncbi:hypothetical protein HED60_13830 [Planctomycetales bacterium ZRK34]|nr:hypothetical protein HED60_13830 [Planctomycetales bacterium ZRK34]
MIRRVHTPGQHGHAVTAIANSGGRLGHQLKDIVTGMIVSELFNIAYLHSPLRDAEWERFMGLGTDECMLTDSHYSYFVSQLVQVSPRWHGISWDSLYNVIRGLQARPQPTLLIFQHAIRVLLVQARQWHAKGAIEHDVYSRVINKLRHKYFCTEHPAKKRIVSEGRYNIAIHIRRGDATVRNGRWLPISYYTNIIDQLESLLSKKSAVFHIYSDGTTNAMDQIRHALTKSHRRIIFHLNESPFATFHQMVVADLLVLGHSTFSDWAGFISSQPKLLHPHYHMTGLDDNEWIYVDKHGNISGDVTLLKNINAR